MNEQHPNIMVVDDNPADLRLICNILQEAGINCRPVLDGFKALKAAAIAPPDIFLLDVKMPQINGYELCRQLKEMPETAQVPVIFLSANHDPESKIKGFEAGAVDYVSKPYNRHEVLARVQTHLQIRALQHKDKQLIEELAAFAGTVSHDLKSPLAILTGFAGELENHLDSMDPTAVRHVLGLMGSSAERMVTIVNSLLLLSRVRQGEFEAAPVDMTAVVEQSMTQLGNQIALYRGTVHLPSTFPKVLGNGPWLEQVCINLIDNALKYGGTQPTIIVSFTAEEDGTILFEVRDEGPGIPEKLQPTIFDEFVRAGASGGRPGNGLGLSIVKRIVTRLNGEVGLESKPGEGATFWFKLPAAPDQGSASAAIDTAPMMTVA